MTAPGGETLFQLAAGIDADALAVTYAASGRVRIAPFLTAESADALHAHLRQREDWRQVVNSGAKTFELDRPTRAAMTPAQVAALDAAVTAGARSGFQYRFESVRVDDGDAARAARGEPIDRFAQFMSGGAVRALLRMVTGAAAIRFADAQATAFAPGDFLTGHDDAVAGKDRHAAYVFGLTPVWRTEWGGLLLFHDGDAVDGWSPAHNVLTLFAVPQLHSVSLVAPAAAYRRYGMTGWLRGGTQPS
ncbi:2OG-Fe(II) oxygenase [Sphingomonas prati]|uniref:Rps23 Pro-64 3,4-dihydroxylase Tpa1-like proline 4-hydroxylase n=1 Tax=Sphingomonas prati TaxID=1843237 RepID=A0A7W9BRV0_9SPHN|nr:2OG-Fe(II) oxygenase family protein [Sphingomonas prati]MBB5728784.1 Rps23 Pro-64 3,4-dihydroxylase Tpa1-like proline 4-hydroxylase [Sphingomonas prati]GGE87580.1 proline hydroxylase [Sphingomonas prati]